MEGEEIFVRDIYKEFKAELLKGHVNFGPTSAPLSKNKLGADNETPKSKNENSTSKKNKGSSKSDVLKIDKNLDLSGLNNAPSLKDFVGQYQPKMNMERNVVFIEYLNEIMGLEKVSINHVWTCYSDLGLRLPVNMRQSLYDTSSLRSWVNVPSIDDLSLSVQGKNWLRDQTKKAETE